MIGTEIDLQQIHEDCVVENPMSITEKYIQPMIEKNIATMNIKWTVEGFEEAWEKYTYLHPCTKSSLEKEKFRKGVKFHYSYKPTPEFLILELDSILELDLQTYSQSWTWSRAIYQQVLVLRKGTIEHEPFIREETNDE